MVEDTRGGVTFYGGKCCKHRWGQETQTSDPRLVSSNLPRDFKLFIAFGMISGMWNGGTIRAEKDSSLLLRLHARTSRVWAHNMAHFYQKPDTKQAIGDSLPDVEMLASFMIPE